MAKGIRRKLRRASDRAYAAMNQHDGSMYARGLASEGYVGGYAQALADVQSMLDGVPPGDPRGFWSDGKTHLDETAAQQGGRSDD